MPQRELEWVEAGLRRGASAVDSFFDRLWSALRTPGTSAQPLRDCTFQQNNTYVQNNVNVTNYTNIYNGVKRKRRRRR